MDSALQDCDHSSRVLPVNNCTHNEHLDARFLKKCIDIFAQKLVHANCQTTAACFRAMPEKPAVLIEPLSDYKRASGRVGGGGGEAWGKIHLGLRFLELRGLSQLGKLLQANAREQRSAFRPCIPEPSPSPQYYIITAPHYEKSSSPCDTSQKSMSG